MVDVNGASTHPLVPLVKGHWEPYDVPEPQYDSFTFGSLKAVGQLPYFSVTSATGLWHRNAILAQDATEGVNSVSASLRTTPRRGDSGHWGLSLTARALRNRTPSGS